MKKQFLYFVHVVLYYLGHLFSKTHLLFRGYQWCHAKSVAIAEKYDFTDIWKKPTQNK